MHDNRPFIIQGEENYRRFMEAGKEHNSTKALKIRNKHHKNKEARMNRLTERFSNGQAAVYGCGNNCKYDYKYCNNAYEDCPTINEIYDKLALYEDLEEQGLLLRLPCKVGTELFLSDYLNAHHRLKEYKFLGNDVAVVIECWEFQRTCTRMLSDFGKIIFLTKEEAEQALKQIGE